MHSAVLRGSFPPPKGAVVVNFPEIMLTSSVTVYTYASHAFFFFHSKGRLMGSRIKLPRTQSCRVCILRRDIGVISNTPRLDGVGQLAVR